MKNLALTKPLDGLECKDEGKLTPAFRETRRFWNCRKVPAMITAASCPDAVFRENPAEMAAKLNPDIGSIALGEAIMCLVASHWLNLTWNLASKSFWKMSGFRPLQFRGGA